MSIPKKENSFLVFSDDFGEHPSSCQHLFRYVPDSCSVLWVNTVGMRTPKLTSRDFKKAILKLGNMIYGMKNNSDKNSLGNINVCQPPMLPFLNVPGIKSINKLSVNSIVNRNIQKLGLAPPIVVVTAPNASDYLGMFGERRTIYYCVDDFAEWPGLDKKLVQKMELELIRKSDILIASSKKLFDKLSNQGKELHLLTHGVDYEFFKNVPRDEHPLLRNIPKPRVGYFGLFDNRSNKDLLEALAKKMPDISFVITGNVETDIARLRKIENLYFTGSIPYDELPAMVNGWDVCILPYKINELTDAIQPLKIKEYMASGKPVISTSIKEACALNGLINIADTIEDWKSSIRLTLSGIQPDTLERRELFLEKESWVAKAEKFYSICCSIS